MSGQINLCLFSPTCRQKSGGGESSKFSPGLSPAGLESGRRGAGGAPAWLQKAAPGWEARRRGWTSRDGGGRRRNCLGARRRRSRSWGARRPGWGRGRRVGAVTCRSVSRTRVPSREGRRRSRGDVSTVEEQPSRLRLLGTTKHTLVGPPRVYRTCAAH